MTRNEILVRTLEEKRRELEQLNRELAEREARLRAIFDAEPECVKLLAADGSLLEINPAGLRMVEADSFPQVANRCMYPLVADDDRAAFRDLTERVFRGETGTLEFQLTGLKGGRRWLETHATPLRDATGVITALVGITRDITASRHAEAALRDSEANFRALFEQVGVGVAQIETVTGRFAQVNRRYCEIVGYTAEEMRRLTFQEITHPEDLQADLDNMARLHRGDIHGFSMEKRYFRKDGTIVWVALTVSAPWNFGGSSTFHTAVVEDITERKRAEEELRQSEAKFRLLAEESLAGVVIIQDGRFQYVNPAMARIMGHSREELLAAPSILDWVAEEDRPLVRENLRRRLEGEVQHLRFAFHARRKDGSLVDLDVLGSLMMFRGRPAVMSTVLDTTGQREVERALRDSEARYSSVVAAMSEGIVLQDRDGRILAANQSAERILGLSQEQIAGRTSTDPRWRAIHEDGSPFPGETHPSMMTLRTGAPELGVIMGVHKPDGALTWLSINSQPICRPGDSHPAMVVTSFADVTDSRRAADSLRQSEERFRELAETIDDVFWMSDPTSNRMLYVSPGYEKTWGRSCQSLYEQPDAWLDTIHPLDRDRVHCAVTARVAGGTYDEEYRVVRPDGEIRWVRDRAFLVRNAAGRAERVVGIARDVQARKTAEEELQRREERFRSLIENAADMIGVINHQGVIQFLSPSADTILGYQTEDVIGRSSLEFVHPADLPHTTAALRKAVANPGTAVSVEYRVHRRDGQWRTLQTIGRSIPDQAPDGFIVLNSRDITDSRHLEEQLRQSQKMEAIGQLAGGIAHDFNNLLTVINGTADLALGNLSAADPLRADLSHIRDAGGRAASLTRQLLAFGRKQILVADVLDLNAVVADMQRMLQRVIGEHIEFAFTSEDNLAAVKADRSQIEQVIVNLVVNARDAMRDGGVLTIETHNVVLDAAFVATHPSAELGPHVMLSVADTGVGMDDQTAKKIFEPFFTTKGPAQNTGLGLATVYGIVKQSGGTIWVDSAPGRGTTFAIYLPLVEGRAREDWSARSAMEAPGTETILIVEDEATVRTLARRFLESAGYTVVTAGTGAEALQLLERDRQPVHLMLTDVVMPGMSGRELAARLASVRPQMKVLYTSGYTDDTILRHGVFDNAAEFIGKPYSKAELTRKVREILDNAGP